MITLYHLLRPVFGGISLLFGVAFSLTPLPFGLLFLTLGVILLSPEVRFFRRLLAWTEKNDPSKNKILARTILRVKNTLADPS